MAGWAAERYKIIEFAAHAFQFPGPKKGSEVVNLPLNRTSWPKKWQELYEERAALIEFQANLSRQIAEWRAEQDIRRVAATEKREERTA